MIGNDIVDLQLARNNSRCIEQRFLEKVFTNEERAIISSAKDKFETIWLLWSMKESAYKIYMQQYSVHFFNPKQVICQFQLKNKGFVFINKVRYTTSSVITKDFIYTVATLRATNKVSRGFLKMDGLTFKSQQQQVHESLIHAFSELESVPSHQLEIQKNQFDIPKLYINHKEQSYSISLTHHGTYGGYAFADVS